MDATAKGTDLAISFDTTGSMYPCLTQVRRQVEALVRRFFASNPGARVAIIAHGDYCDAHKTYVMQVLDFTSDLAKIVSFIRNVGPTWGGDAPECYELVLNQARALNWGAGHTKTMVLIGDDEPHEPDYLGNVKKIDWRNELRLLVEMGIQVYGVHALASISPRSQYFYKEIARVTGGFYLTLDQFHEVVDLILAVFYRQNDMAQFQAFQAEVQAGRRMSRGMARSFAAMGGTAVDMAAAPAGLVPVPAGRFQIIEVDADQDIKGLVIDQGLAFKKGRGFYQFTKTETVQERKEVVLRDKVTGDMYTGAEAREMIGLPYGQRGRIKPTALDQYDVFVQSTSVNRKLIGGTLFLYEIEDWDRAMAA